MSRIASRAFVLAALAAFFAAPAAAQERPRTGLWVDAGGGIARLRLRCTNCSSTGTASGGTATLTLGGAVSRKVVLGLEGQIWRSWEAGPREEVRSLTVVAQWYPFPGQGFFVRGGTGIVQGPVVPSVSGAQPASVSGTGVGLTLGVGWDVRLGRRLAVALQAASHVAALGDLDLPGYPQPLQDTIAYVTRLAVALVFR